MDNIIFTVCERIQIPWLYILIGFLIVISSYTAVKQLILHKPVGTRPGPGWMVFLFWIFCTIGVPAFILSAKMTITVDDQVLTVKSRTLGIDREVQLDDIVSAEETVSRPLFDAAGWGNRGLLPGTKYYSLGGNTGVMVTLENGAQFFIGTGDSSRLLDSIEKGAELSRQ